MSLFERTNANPSAIVLVWLAAVTVRLLYLAVAYFGYGLNGVIAEDSLGLIATADAVRAGDTALGFDGDRRFDGSIMPLPILLLALAGSPAVFLIVQTAIDATTCVLIALLAAAVQPRWFLTAGIIAALNPTQIVLSGIVLTDSLFLMFATAALLPLMHAACQRRPDLAPIRGAFLFGGALGLALLSRSAIVPWIPVGVAVFMLLSARKDGWAHAAIRTGIALILVAVLAAPILYRNAICHGSATLTRQGGYHLLFWVVPLVGSFGAGQDRATVEAEARDRLDATLSTAAQTESTTENALAQDIAREMLSEFGPTAILKAWSVGSALNMGLPAATIAPMVRLLPHESFYDTAGHGAWEKAVNFLTADTNRTYVAVIVGAGFAVFPWLILLPIGLWRLTRQAPLAAVIVLLWGGYILALNGPVASPKYRLPLEPVWIVSIVAALRAVPDDQLRPLSP